jgi:hypothetical protein
MVIASLISMKSGLQYPLINAQWIMRSVLSIHPKLLRQNSNDSFGGPSIP